MKAGTILSGGNTVLLWLLLIAASAGVGKAFDLVTAPIFWGVLAVDVVSLLAVMGYRRLKARATVTGVELGAERGSDD